LGGGAVSFARRFGARRALTRDQLWPVACGAVLFQVLPYVVRVIDRFWRRFFVIATLGCRSDSVKHRGVPLGATAGPTDVCLGLTPQSNPRKTR